MTISHEETCRLCELVRAGDAPAADRLVRAHMGIVWKVLERAGRKGDDELIQEGRLGLWYAASRFDPSRARWSTFAHRVVRQWVGKAIRRRQGRQAGALPDARFLPGPQPPDAPAGLGDLLAALPDDHRRLLHHLYSGEKRRTLAEAAADLGVTQHRAARLHREALDLLREASAEREAA